MNARDDHRPGLRVVGWSFAALGAAAVGASLWFEAGLVLYFIALGVMIAGLVAASATLWTDRARRTGFTVTTVIVVVAAVAAPWHPADQERQENPHAGIATNVLWGLDTAGAIGNVYSDGSRILFTDNRGITAVDLKSGSVLWSHDKPSSPAGINKVRVERMDVATDGHVLVRFKILEGRRDYSWISPEGDVLWSSYATSDRRNEVIDLDVDDFASLPPRASSGGSLVVVTCEVFDDPTTCRYLGIAADGSEQWSLEWNSEHVPLYSQHAINDLPLGENVQEIPEVAVVNTGGPLGDGDLTPAMLIDAVNGQPIVPLEVGQSIAVLGDTVVYEVGPADEAGLCTMRGLSADGDVSWERDMPCLSAGGVVLGPWIYGTLEDVQGPAGMTATGVEFSNSYAMDPSTGEWQDVGPLAYFNQHDAASQTGVPGTDVVVQRHDQRLTRIDPHTGEEGWVLDVPEATSGPKIEAAHGAAAVIYQPGTSRSTFTSEEDPTRDTEVLALDTRTGRVTGSVRSPSPIIAAVPASPGQVLVAQEGWLTLIGEAPS